MRQPSKGISLECIERNAAGIDVGAKEIDVVLPPDRYRRPIRRLKTFTAYAQGADPEESADSDSSCAQRHNRAQRHGHRRGHRDR